MQISVMLSNLGRVQLHPRQFQGPEWLQLGGCEQGSGGELALSLSRMVETGSNNRGLCWIFWVIGKDWNGCMMFASTGAKGSRCVIE